MMDFPKGTVVMDSLASTSIAESTRGKVIVIGTGRFGNAVVQGIEESCIHLGNTNRPELIATEVVHVSATQFMNLNVREMTVQLQDTKFIVYTGIHLPKYATKLANSMQRAKSNIAKKASIRNNDCVLEFLDFSNPDPILEKDDVSGSIDLWNALHDNGTKSPGGWKVWKITECGSLDVAGTDEAHHDYAKVYGAGIAKSKVPKLKIKGLRWDAAPPERQDLYTKARDRIMDRAEVDRWYDGVLLGLAILLYTWCYAVTRYSVTFNGKYPWSMIPMYVTDKAIAWTALWLMVVSPFAGNLLAMKGIIERWSRTSIWDKLMFISSALAMAWPIFEFIIPWFLWYLFRNLFFHSIGRSPSQLYKSQYPSMHEKAGTGETSHFKAMLVDMVSLKGETGVTGFIYVLAHSFIGFIVADASYKKWFGKETGRLLWWGEICLVTGCISTAFLFAVALRSLFGKAT